MTTPLMRHTALFTGVFLLLAGFGLVGSLVSMGLAASGHTGWVGWVGGAYFVGLGLGSLRGERTIAQVGYIRAYGVLTSLACLGVLMLALADAPMAWLVARLVQGFALGGLYVCIESWLGTATAPDQRGRVLATYQIVVYVGLVFGQAMLGWLAAEPLRAIVAAACFVCLAAIPVGGTNQQVPELIVQPDVHIGEVIGHARLGLLGALVSGLTTGAIYTVAPAAGLVADLSEREVAWLMASFITGGMLLQMPLGRVSDVLDRRAVLAAIASLGAVGAILSMLVLGSPRLLIAAALFEGGWIFAIYTVSLAYIYDRVPHERLVAANAATLMVFCAGSVAGSTGSSLLLVTLGAFGFYLALLLPCVFLAAVAMLYQQMREPIPVDERSPAQAVPLSSTAVVELDPRIDLDEQVSFTDEVTRAAGSQ